MLERLPKVLTDTLLFGKGICHLSAPRALTRTVFEPCREVSGNADGAGGPARQHVCWFIRSNKMRCKTLIQDQ